MKRLIRRFTHPHGEKALGKGIPNDEASHEQNYMSKSAPQEKDSMGNSIIGGTHNFSFVPGFFEDYAQIANTLPDGKISTQPALGILSRDYDSLGTDLQFDKGAPQWVRFEKYIQYLNRQHIDDGISYKLMYVIRHGRGIHNVKMDELKISEETGQLELVDGIPLNWKVRHHISYYHLYSLFACEKG